jgi:mannose-6-phosphate isomerase-like protein (cupin superfamily)
VPIVPNIVGGHTVSKWRRAGINRNKHGFLTTSTDMILLKPSSKQPEPGTIPLNKLPWNVNLKRIPPGAQSSNAHCHSHEDEFVFVLSGKARYWHQGEVPEKIVKKGDTIGWKAGTGICHSLLNDADGPNGEGKKTFIWHLEVSNTINLYRGRLGISRMGR